MDLSTILKKVIAKKRFFLEPKNKKKQAHSGLMLLHFFVQRPIKYSWFHICKNKEWCNVYYLTFSDYHILISRSHLGVFIRSGVVMQRKIK